MGMSGADYRRQLQKLLPQGLAWPRREDSTLTKMLDGFAQEFSRIDVRTNLLIEEADPRTTSELLEDWERVAGLPDNCAGTLRDTMQGRRQALVSKLISQGGQSKAYYIGVAKELGYTISVNEYRAFRAGQSRAGDPLTNGDWRFVWEVQCKELNITPFRAGVSAAGESLATWGNADLECRITKFAPAHTKVTFTYGDYVPTALLTEQGDALLNQSGTGILLETT